MPEAHLYDVEMAESLIALGSVSNTAEFEHIVDMMHAIKEQVAWNGDPDNQRHHGGFVCAMADQAFDQAFIKADSVNRRYFGLLMHYRLITLGSRE